MTFYTAQEIGDIVREQRALKGMSQAQLSFQIKYKFPKICCCQATLSMIESGKQKASLEQISAIAWALKIPVTVFFKENLLILPVATIPEKI